MVSLTIAGVKAFLGGSVVFFIGFICFKLMEFEGQMVEKSVGKER